MNRPSRSDTKLGGVDGYSCQETKKGAKGPIKGIFTEQTGKHTSFKFVKVVPINHLEMVETYNFSPQWMWLSVERRIQTLSLKKCCSYSKHAIRTLGSKRQYFHRWARWVKDCSWRWLGPTWSSVSGISRDLWNNSRLSPDEEFTLVVACAQQIRRHLDSLLKCNETLHFPTRTRKVHM